MVYVNFIYIFIFILCLITVIISIAYLLSWRERRHNLYSKRKKQEFTTCEINPSNEEFNAANNFVNRNKSVYIFKSLIIFALLQILIIIGLCFFNVDIEIKIYIDLILSFIIISFLIANIIVKYSMFYFLKCRYGVKRSFKIFFKGTYDESKFSCEKVVLAKNSIKFVCENHPVFMHGIEIYRSFYPYRRRDDLPIYETPDFQGVFTIIRKVSNDSLNFELLSDLNENNIYKNEIFNNDVYKLYTKENFQFNYKNVTNYLMLIYNKYQLLFDVRCINGSIFIRSNNGCILERNSSVNDYLEDLACNIVSFESIYNLIKLLLSI